MRTATFFEIIDPPNQKLYPDQKRCPCCIHFYPIIHMIESMFSLVKMSKPVLKAVVRSKKLGAEIGGDAVKYTNKKDTMEVTTCHIVYVKK